VGFFYALFFYKDVKYMDYFVFIKKIKRREEEEYITRRGVYGRRILIDHIPHLQPSTIRYPLFAHTDAVSR
jgi:hypothetical protein